MQLIINSPKIETKDEYSILSSDIIYGERKQKYNMWFKVPKEYGQYLNEETSDAFLVSLIPFIVKYEYDVKIEGKISSKLYYQLESYLLPMLCRAFNKRRLRIDCSLTNNSFNGNAVGASISCGVDSFYTLLKHRNLNDSDYNITHLTFFNAGSHGEYGGDDARKRYYDRLAPITKFCKEYNYNLVTVDSNMNELIHMNHEKTHTFRTLGCVFALEKLFGKYYFASGLEFDGSHIDEADTAYYDILNVHCLSNENINFYCSGLETTRMDKIKLISQYDETYNWLNVCVHSSTDNCGKCEKCIRTMTALDAIGKLDDYKNVFDIESFYKNKSEYLTKIIEYNRDKIKHQLYQEIIDEYKKHKNPFTIGIYLKSFRVTKSKIKRKIKKLIPQKLFNKLKTQVKKNGIKDDGWK